jgi:hypothetical protein
MSRYELLASAAFDIQPNTTASGTQTVEVSVEVTFIVQ